VFTLIVSLVVVAAAVVAVVRMALADPSQPATAGRVSHRARPAPSVARTRRRRPKPVPPKPPVQPVPVGAVVNLDRVGFLRRIRSGFALLLLLALVGTLLATAVGALLFMAGLALRNAVS
jgi:hypothetical protein